MHALGEVLVAHCDWSKDARKQWVAVGRVAADGTVVARAPERVGEAGTLLDRLRRAADGVPVLAGFDFPIGVPRAYAERAGIESLPGFLRTLAAGGRSDFFAPAALPTDISVGRPFYPAATGSSKHQHLIEGLGVDGINDLRRVCERRSGGRRAASPLFWLVGAAQVGRAAIAGWREVLIPAYRHGEDVSLWPFDGELSTLLERGGIVLAETYPTEFYEHLHAQPGPGGKRSRSGRAPACAALAAAASRLGVQLTADAQRALDVAFGDGKDGEDRFDAFVGLLGMLNIVLGHRDPGPPSDLMCDVVEVEGWILGQGAGGLVPAAPAVRDSSAAPSDRLASLIRQRDALNAEIVAIIGPSAP